MSRILIDGPRLPFHCSGCCLKDPRDDMRCLYFGDLYAEQSGEFAFVPERPAECISAEVEGSRENARETASALRRMIASARAEGARK